MQPSAAAGAAASLSAARPEALRRARAGSEGATLFMVLLAAFQACSALHRPGATWWSARRSPTATGSEIEGLIGFFVNTLVLRTDLARRPAFRALLARVRETALGAYAHQDLPFEQLVEELRPRAQPRPHAALPGRVRRSRTRRRGGCALPGLELAPLAVETGTAKFDLTLSWRESRRRAGWALLEYAADLFDAATVERLAGHLGRSWRGARGRSGPPVAELPLLTAAERRSSRAWNGRPARLSRATRRSTSSSRRRWRGAPGGAGAGLSAGERVTYARARPRGRAGSPRRLRAAGRGAGGAGGALSPSARRD